MLLGYCYSGQRDFQAAVKCYETVVSQRRASADVYNNLGFCLNQLRRNTEARGVLNRAIQLDRKHQLALANLASVELAIARKERR